MIIELYGLPGSGKTTIAAYLGENSHFQQVTIGSSFELLLYSFLFFLRHPLRTVMLGITLCVFSGGFRLWYTKFMNLFLHHNAKYAKASLLTYAIIDQGHCQNILSLFERSISENLLRRYMRWLPKPDLLVLFHGDSEVREARLQKRGYGVRERWQEGVNKNFVQSKHLFQDMGFQVVSCPFGRSIEEVANAVREAIMTRCPFVYIVNARMPTEKAYGHQIIQMCAQFSALGLPVQLWRPYRKNPITETVFTYYDVKENFFVRTLGRIDFMKWNSLFFKRAQWLQEIFFLSSLFFTRIVRGTIGYTRDPSVAWLLKKKGAFVVYECHDWFGKSKTLALFFLRKVDLIVSTNRFIEGQFEKASFQKESLVLAPNGVDLSVFDIDVTKEEARKKIFTKQQNTVLDSKKIILYEGSFRTMGKEKGIIDIIQSLVFLPDDIMFIGVGGSMEDIEYYTSYARSLLVHKRVVLLSRVSHETLALYLKAADVLVLPFPQAAHYTYFMTPLKMFEYMASRRVVVTTDLPSIREILSEDNAFFCPPSDPKAMAERILFALKNPLISDTLAGQAYRDVGRFSWEKRAKKILYRSVPI